MNDHSSLSKKFQWHHLYYLLAAFNVLTISLALYLFHTVLGNYSRSVEDNAVWSERVAQFSRLNELAAAINAPGNDAFDSGDIAGERRRLAEASQAFQKAITAARKDLQQNGSRSESAEPLRKLDQINDQVALIGKEATALFVDLENNKNETAGSRMAEMNRCFSRSLTIIRILCEDVRQIQATRFETETIRAQQLGRFEFAIAGVACLILCVVAWYGDKMAEHNRNSERQTSFSERRLKAIVESAVDPIVTITARGLIESFNPAAERLFGYTESEVLGKNVRLLMPPPFREEHDGYLAHYLKTGQKNVIGIGREVVGERKEGTTFPLWLSVSEAALESDDSHGSPRLFTGILRDLTEQKLREDELLRANQKAEELSAFGQILDRSLNEIYIFDARSLHSVHVNHGARENIGYTMDELREMTPLDIMPKHTAASFEKLVVPLLDGTEENIQFSSIHRRKDGSEYPVTAHLQTAYFAGTKVFIAVILDMTERQMLDEELRESREKALAADRLKSEFLANMSHEIRTPMTAILGYTDLLLDSLTDPDEVDAARTVKKNGDYLLELINDILDLSKVEAGKFDVEQVGCSPHALISDVASLMRVRIAEKGLSLRIRFDGPIPEMIQTDPTRLRQILINIVGNAIKFTETGSVQIVTRLLNDPGNEPKLQFEVIDTGIGFAEGSQEKLFKPFMQADNSTTRRFGGTGLGLTISKRLVELLGGELSVSSTVGKGSTFGFTVSTGSLDDVPLLQCAEESIGEIKNALMVDHTTDSLHNCRVLLAEDGLDNQRLISYLLTKAGAEVAIAEHGQMAFDLAMQALEEDHPFDVILMDMQMPVMDGYAASRRLRFTGYTKPIIALTAHAMTGDRQRCLEAGCNDYITKPIDRMKLIDMLRNLSDGRLTSPPNEDRSNSELLKSATP